MHEQIEQIEGASPRSTSETERGSPFRPHADEHPSCHGRRRAEVRICWEIGRVRRSGVNDDSGEVTTYRDDWATQRSRKQQIAKGHSEGADW